MTDPANAGPGATPGLPAPASLPPHSGPPRSSLLLVVVTIALLALLVWALNPSQPKLKPAPLRPLPSGCLNRAPDFQPSNVTEIPDLPAQAGLPSDPSKRGSRSRVLLRLNMEPCSCGCNLSLAACRTAQPDCEASKEATQKVLVEEKAPVTEKP